MDDVVKGMFQLIVEILKFLVMVVFIHFFFFNLGRLSLWLFTAGKYPRGALAERDVNWTIIAGFMTFVLFILGMGFYNEMLGAPPIT